MTLLPSPLPHPLDRPVDVPFWARPALEWVVGFDWPPGDEVATWEVADRWYALADALTGPRARAVEAAAEIIAGYDAAGASASGFLDAWHRLSGDEDAPLNALVQIVHELGELVDGCGRDIEAAKLEAWIEIGVFLTELTGIAVVGALTLGAAAPAAGGLIAATRIAIQEIFERLAGQLSGVPRPTKAGQPDSAPHPAEVGQFDNIPRPTDIGQPDSAPHPTNIGQPDSAPHPTDVRQFDNVPHPADVEHFDNIPRPADVEQPDSIPRPVPLPRHRAGRSSSSNLPTRPHRPPSPTDQETPPNLATSPPPGKPTLPPDPPDPAPDQAKRRSNRITLPPDPVAWLSGQPARHSHQGPRHSDRAARQPDWTADSALRPRDVSRRTREQSQRADYARYLTSIAEQTWSMILDLERLAVSASRNGTTSADRSSGGREVTDADELLAVVERRAVELRAIVAELEARTDLVRSGKRELATADADPPPWARLDTDADDHPSWTESDSPWPYGGLRAPLGVPQRELEDAMPRAGDGRVRRLADPRLGRWFSLVNGGGPAADPTRGLNCLEAVLALFDAYLNGRPRIAAPRAFDAYAHGDPNRPVGGDEAGVKRVELTTGGRFQNLCPYVGRAEPALAKPSMDAALRNLANHLHNSGHGAFAFVITDLDSGGCHCWAAINQTGTILFLDPQVGSIDEEVPLYRHHGLATAANVVSMDALVVDGEGRPAPLPYHGPGQWTSANGAHDSTPPQA